MLVRTCDVASDRAALPDAHEEDDVKPSRRDGVPVGGGNALERYLAPHAARESLEPGRGADFEEPWMASHGGTLAQRDVRRATHVRTHRAPHATIGSMKRAVPSSLISLIVLLA